MFKHFKFCCSSSFSDFSLLINLIRSNKPLDSFKLDLLDRTDNQDYLLPKFNLPVADNYYFSVLIDSNNEYIKQDLDFLYFCKAEGPVKTNIKDLENSAIGLINIETAVASGHCYFSLQRLDLSYAYFISYMRKDPKTGNLKILGTSKKFKIGFKNKIYNLFLDSIPDIASQDLAIFYEDDSFFDKINTKKLSKAHKKNFSMIPLNDTTLTSTATKSTSSSKNPSFGDRAFHNRYSKDSMCITSISSMGESIVFQSLNANNNRDLLQGNFHRSSWNKNESISFSTGKQYFNEGDKEECLAVADGLDDSVIIDENKENDEYIHKLCTIYDENLKTSHEGHGHYYDSLTKTRDKYNSSGKMNRGSGGKNDAFCGNARRCIDFSQSIITTSPEAQGSHTRVQSLSFVEKEPSFICEKGSPKMDQEEECYAKESEKMSIHLGQRRKATDFSSSFLEQAQLPQLIRQSREENLEQKHHRARRESFGLELNHNNHIGGENKIIYNRTIIPETNSDELQDEDEVDNILRNDSSSFAAENEEFQDEIGFPSDEEGSEEQDNQDESNLKGYYRPQYSNRLYTVEEVCSPSKESSLGWELQFRMVNSGSVSNGKVPNSSHYKKEKCARTDTYEGRNLDFENMSAPITQNSFREMPLEVMILKQKVENLGLRLDYSQEHCLVCIYDKNKKDMKQFIRWYEDTSDKDLYDYFDGILDGIKHILASENSNK